MGGDGEPTATDKPGLRELDLAPVYDTADAALTNFYVPALQRAVSYDRSVGYFRASALSAAAQGMARFINDGGTARFVIGADVAAEDVDALEHATEIPEQIARRLADGLITADDIETRRLEVLAWLLEQGRLEIKIAVPVDEDGRPLTAEAAAPYFHEKLGVLRDAHGDGVAFQGSVNESANAWQKNFESMSVFRSWDGSAEYYANWVDKFEQRWSGDIPGFKLFAPPDAIRQGLLDYLPDEEPPERDPAEPAEAADSGTVASFLRVTPRLIGSDRLAEATSGVTLFPHQQKVSRRLAGAYPRSWLVADEVGLGKTISAGVSLRRLLISRRVQRALILAPANVCVQWQDELFEKFGLWVPRLDGNKIHGVHPDDVAKVPAGVNPYAEHDVLLVSSHLARRREHQERILEAPPYDLLIVDEAHHARRHAADPDKYQPTRLLQLLDRFTETGHARATWLLTATPMQIHPIELFDLLRQVGLHGDLARFDLFLRYYNELAKTDDAKTDWGFLARSLGGTPLPPLDGADRAVLDRIDTKLGAVQRERVGKFGRAGTDTAALVDDLGAPGRAELRAWLRHRSPVGELITRHSRITLKQYRDQGLLKEPVADRDVAAVTIPFTKAEQDLYEELDGLLDRLMEAHGTRKGAGFILNVYRRRLTSSWQAIRRTLQRRLGNEALLLETDLLDDAEEELEADDGTLVDDTEAVPLSAEDLTQIHDYVQLLSTVSDSKFDALEAQINTARGQGRAIVVFTQFTDTLEYLRDRLQPAYRSQLATYSGKGGERWTEDAGWVALSKQQLVELVRSRAVSVVVATDAASEGLNLQAASYLVCWDLPYNPMRVEQRIGRIDRIGQPEKTVIVRNFVIPGTVEESVYAALAERIDLFTGLVGRLQPILGATEAAFNSVFRRPKSERVQATADAVSELTAKIDELEAGGLDLSDEDPLPIDDQPEPPVTLDELHRCLSEQLDVDLATIGRPVTSNPTRVSRDIEQWTALTTYGHPRLDPAFARIIEAEPADKTLVIREIGSVAVAYRADRTPPERVKTLAQLVDLGEAAALGEAEQRAMSDVKHAASEQQAFENEIVALREEAWEQRIRDRFRQLVVTTIDAEIVLRRNETSEAPEAHTVWLDLNGDDDTGWSNADLFRQHLEMDLDQLLSRGLPGADDRTNRELKGVRTRTGEKLIELIQEWMAVKFLENG